jgi:hypothetical protein
MSTYQADVLSKEECRNYDILDSKGVPPGGEYSQVNVRTVQWIWTVHHLDVVVTEHVSARNDDEGPIQFLEKDLAQ